MVYNKELYAQAELDPDAPPSNWVALLNAARALAVVHGPWSTVFPRLFNDPNGPWLERFPVGALDGDIDGALEVAQERFTQIMAEG